MIQGNEHGICNAKSQVVVCNVNPTYVIRAFDCVLIHLWCFKSPTLRKRVSESLCIILCPFHMKVWEGQ